MLSDQPPLHKQVKDDVKRREVEELLRQCSVAERGVEVGAKRKFDTPQPDKGMCKYFSGSRTLYSSNLVLKLVPYSKTNSITRYVIFLIILTTVF